MRNAVLMAILLPLAVVMRPLPAHGQAGDRVIGGRVTERGGAALKGVEVRLLASGVTLELAHTDSAGRYQFIRRAIPVDALLHLRRLGFTPVRIAVGRTTGAVDVELVAAAVELDGVIVSAPSAHGVLAEFYAHREQSAFGRFFTPEDIERERPRMLSELMRRVPGARLLPARFGSLVRIRGCRPTLWIDGIRVSGAELDEAVNINDVAAVEVYNSFAGIPAQYVDRTNDCGAVVVWFKT